MQLLFHGKSKRDGIDYGKYTIDVNEKKNAPGMLLMSSQKEAVSLSDIL